MTKSNSAKPERRKRSQETAGEDEFQSDLQTKIKKCAEDERERRVTLAEALNRWANVDIVRLQRIEDGNRCGWALWKRAP